MRWESAKGNTSIKPEFKFRRDAKESWMGSGGDDAVDDDGWSRLKLNKCWKLTDAKATLQHGSGKSLRDGWWRLDVMVGD